MKNGFIEHHKISTQFYTISRKCFASAKLAPYRNHIALNCCEYG